MKPNLIIAAALLAGAAVFAADQEDRMLRIESSGQVLAEIRLLAPCRFLCDKDASHLSVKDGVARYRATGPALEGTLLFNDGQEAVTINGNVEIVGRLEDLGLKAK